MQAVSNYTMLIPAVLVPLMALVLAYLFWQLSKKHSYTLGELATAQLQAVNLRKQVEAATEEDRFNLALWRKNASTGVLVYANQRARMTIFTPVGVTDPLGVRMEDMPINPEAIKTLQKLDEHALENPDHGMLGLVRFHPKNDWHLVLKNYMESKAGESLIQGIAFKPHNMPANPEQLDRLLNSINVDRPKAD